MNKTIKYKGTKHKGKLKKKHSTQKILKKHNLSQDEKAIICSEYSRGYKSFEQQLEDVFKENKMDITSTSYNLEKETLKELKKAVSPSNILPNQDFYSYINERWMKDIKLDESQKYIIKVDNFRLLQDDVYKRLIDIVNNYIKNPSTKNTPLGKCISTAYSSFQIYNTNKQTQENIAKYVKSIDTFIHAKNDNDNNDNDNNLWKLLAMVNSNEIISWGSPFVWSINPDDMNPSKYICYINPPELSLLDLDIYYNYNNDNAEMKKYKNNQRITYLAYLQSLFEVAFGKEHTFNVKDIYDCEIELLDALSCNVIKEDENEQTYYNVVTKEESLKHFGFDWVAFCKAFGFKRVPNKFIVSNVNYFLCMTKLVKEKWNTPAWRTYWIYLYIREQTRWDEKGWLNYYLFKGEFLRGREKAVDTHIKPIFRLGFLFNTFLSKEYIDHYKNIPEINYVKMISEDLRIVFMRIIRRNKWLQPKTKLKALKKLEAVKIQIGDTYDHLEDDPILDYKKDDPWGNIVLMAHWRNKKAIQLVDKNVINIPVIDWSLTPPKFVSKQTYVVNAMYTPAENTVYIPLAYIQKPFIDIDDRDIEYNLAHIGFTIAHELSHSLDDLGSKYDENGKLVDWWTKKDKEQFRKIQKNIVKEYETFASYDKIKLNAWPTIGENLADISSFNICLEYLRDFQLKNKDILPIKSISFEKFFVYFAFQARQKISQKAILAELKTNPHPLDKYRCNVPLSRSLIFRTMYKVKKGDKMWWSSTNNVW